MSLQLTGSVVGRVALTIGRMFSQAQLEIKTAISLFLVTSLVILRFSHDSLTIPMPILLSLCLFFYPYAYSLIPMPIPLSLCSPESSFHFPTLLNYF